MSKQLYHGSIHKEPKNKKLSPGFYHTNELVTWENPENNKFLYFTTERNSAVAMALAAYFETVVTHMLGFHHDPIKKTITIDIQKPAVAQRLIPIWVTDLLRKMPGLLVYTVDEVSSQAIVVHNSVNTDGSEYKTSKRRVEYTSVEEINVLNWFNENNYKLFYQISPEIHDVWITY